MTISGSKKRIEEGGFQTEVQNEGQWKLLLKQQGLTVVDVYASWTGPCTGMVGILRRVRAELNDDRLHYAIACSDEIHDLLMFKNQSEPAWLFLAGGQPVQILRGANAPQLCQLIKTELAHEIECMAGKEVRRPIVMEDDVSRRKKAEMEIQRLVGILKEEDEQETGKIRNFQKALKRAEFLAEYLAAARRASSVRLMEELTSYTVLVIQPFLVGGQAEDDIRASLAEDFLAIGEVSVDMNEDSARKLYKIPLEGYSSGESVSSRMSTARSQTPSRVGLRSKRGPRVALPVPPEILGVTLIILLESRELKKMRANGISPKSDSPLQTADDYLRLRVGPIKLEDAKNMAPYSLHAVYGQGENMPGVWAPRTYDDKRHVMLNFFPEFVSMIVSGEPNTSPKYFVAIFPAGEMDRINHELVLYRPDFLAEDVRLIEDEPLIEELSRRCRSQEECQEKARLLKQEVYILCTDTRDRPEIEDEVKRLSPIYFSPDSSSGRDVAARIFPDLRITPPGDAGEDEVIQAFLARSKARIPNEDSSARASDSDRGQTDGDETEY